MISASFEARSRAGASEFRGWTKDGRQEKEFGRDGCNVETWSRETGGPRGYRGLPLRD